MLIAILSSVAVPQIQQLLKSYRLTASANLVATELSAGRALAVSRNRLYNIDCNTTTTTIQIVDPADSNNNPRTAKSLEPDITFSSVPSQAIRFYSRGHAGGGTIVLQNQDGDTLSVVVSVSGRIEIQ